MREIKFRGKRKDNEEWIYGYLIILESPAGEKNYFILPEEFKIDWTDKYPGTQILENFHEVIPETVGQYTGSKDKNGREIYDGDIVKNLANNSILKVEFGMEGVIFINKKGQSVFPMKKDRRLELEVIGNIYENPELLNEVDEE